MSLWNERYDSTEYIFGTEPNDFLRSAQRWIPPEGKVLCLGEGEGRNAVFLASQGFRVTAVDAAEIGLRKARALANARGIGEERLITQVMDLAAFPWESEAWDAVVTIFCHLPPLLRRTVHTRACTALRPGGVFLLEAYTLRQLPLGTGGPSNPTLLYSLEMLREDLSGLEELHGIELQRHLREGKAHVGPSEVVQFGGRRPHTD